MADQAPPKDPSSPMDLEYKIRDFEFDGIKVRVKAALTEGHRPVIRRIEIEAERLRPDDLRSIPLSRIEASFVYAVLPGGLVALTNKSTTESRAEFIERVASAYRSAYRVTNKPAVAIAAQVGVPVGTVRGWIREARLRGLLPAGERGRAG